MPAFLDICEVRKRFGKVEALSGVSFQIAAGELFGLLGPNGAGKTTLMRIVGCLMDADSGAATLDGRPLSSGDRDVRRQIGLVPQELALYGELTARENLAFFGRLYGLSRGALKDRVELGLTTASLVDRADDRISTLSGGMKRRLNLAVSLMHSPRLLLLDEPTTGVDPQSRVHLFDAIRRVNAAGVTVIHTSHYMDEVQSLCPRVGIIDHGKLVTCDSVAELLRSIGGALRLKLTRPAPSLKERLLQLPGVIAVEESGQQWDVDCRSVREVMLPVLAALHEGNVELEAFETEEPNLERVFLSLTGRSLRE